MQREMLLLKEQLLTSDNPLEAAYNHLVQELGSSNVRFEDNLVTGIMLAGRGDGSESLIMVAPSTKTEAKASVCSMALLLTLIGHYKKLSWWSKDLLFLIPSGKKIEIPASIENWFNKYYGTFNNVPRLSSSLPQVGMILEIENDRCDALFGAPSIVFDGSYGLLPNLDTINTFTTIFKQHRSLPKIRPSSIVLGSYLEGTIFERFYNLALALWRTALNDPELVHGALLRNRVDALTLRFSERDNDSTRQTNYFEILELASRSFNNLLEHLHQSFNIYLLVDATSFFSIADYMALGLLPIAALVIRYMGLRRREEYTWNTLIPLIGTSILSTLVCIFYRAVGFRWIIGILPVALWFALPDKFLTLIAGKKVARAPIYLLMALALSTIMLLNFGLAFFMSLSVATWHIFSETGILPLLALVYLSFCYVIVTTGNQSNFLVDYIKVLLLSLCLLEFSQTRLKTNPIYSPTTKAHKHEYTTLPKMEKS